MDREPFFQTDSQTTLITVCFVSSSPPLCSPSPPAPASPVLRQTHLKSILKTKQELVFGAALVGPLDAWGTKALFHSFYSSAIWSRLLSTIQNALGLLPVAHFNQIEISFMVFFHFRDGYWAADRISSAPKCFRFLPSLYFLSSLQRTPGLYQGPHTCSVSRPVERTTASTFPMTESGCRRRSLCVAKWIIDGKALQTNSSKRDIFFLLKKGFLEIHFFW